MDETEDTEQEDKKGTGKASTAVSDSTGIHLSSTENTEKRRR